MDESDRHRPTRSDLVICSSRAEFLGSCTVQGASAFESYQALSFCGPSFQSGPWAFLRLRLRIVARGAFRGPNKTKEGRPTVTFFAYISRRSPLHFPSFSSLLNRLARAVEQRIQPFKTFENPRTLSVFRKVTL